MIGIVIMQLNFMAIPTINIFSSLKSHLFPYAFSSTDLPTSYFQFFSRDLKSPHIVRVTEGQSTSVDCGRWTTGIYELTSLVWKIRFGSQFRSLAPHDRVYVGRNSSLLLLQPRNATYSCSLQYYQVRPAVTFSGYIRIIVEGECHLNSCYNF